MLSDYGMQPLSGVEYGGMLSDTIRVPFAEAMLQPVPSALDPEALASVSDNVLDGSEMTTVFEDKIYTINPNDVRRDAACGPAA